MLSVTAVLSVFVWVFYTAMGYTLPTLNFWYILIISAVATVAEAISYGGIDNLTVPSVTAILYYYGEYEVFGNYVRVRDIAQVNNEKRVEPLIYTFNDINGGLNLYGGFPRHRTEKQYYRQITNTPNLIIELLEKENICRHN
jgi:hypothetical protein